MRTLADQAAHCKLNEGGLSRIKNRKSGPNGPSIAAILTAFPDWSFDDLFEVVPSDELESAS